MTGPNTLLDGLTLAAQPDGAEIIELVGGPNHGARYGWTGGNDILVPDSRSGIGPIMIVGGVPMHKSGIEIHLYRRCLYAPGYFSWQGVVP